MILNLSGCPYLLHSLLTLPSAQGFGETGGSLAATLHVSSQDGNILRNATIPAVGVLCGIIMFTMQRCVCVILHAPGILPGLAYL